MWPNLTRKGHVSQMHMNLEPGTLEHRGETGKTISLLPVGVLLREADEQAHLNTLQLPVLQGQAGSCGWLSITC